MGQRHIIGNKYMKKKKKRLRLLINEEIQIKTTRRYHLMLVKIATIKKQNKKNPRK